MRAPALLRTNRLWPSAVEATNTGVDRCLREMQAPGARERAAVHDVQEVCASSRPWLTSHQLRPTLARKARPVDSVCPTPRSRGQKPPGARNVLNAAVFRAIRARDHGRGAATEPRALRDPGRSAWLIGRARIQDLKAKIEKISRYRTNVLLLGESGSGKELVARLIHARGPRHARRFEPQNCATLSAELLASELFGHEQGSFTGAHARKVGLFEVADGGTLLLDEIAEMDVTVQAKLLRVLEMRRFRRLGGTELHDIDLSIIAATNQDLPALVEQGRFRADLYYRLKVVTIAVPPLRDRRDDIPLLVESFIQQFTAGTTRRSRASPARS